MRVNINGAGHQVEVDVDHSDLSYVIEKAQRLWDETKPERASPGYAGFQMDREHRYDGPANLFHGETPIVNGKERSG